MAWKHIIRLPSIINGLIPVDVPFNFSSHACWIKLGFRYNDHKILNPIPPKAEALKIDILPKIISKLLTVSYNNQIIWTILTKRMQQSSHKYIYEENISCLFLFETIYCPYAFFFFFARKTSYLGILQRKIKGMFVIISSCLCVTPKAMLKGLLMLPIHSIGNSSFKRCNIDIDPIPKPQPLIKPNLRKWKLH